MPWSNIDDAYKIQNFNSDQGKRFYKYKMTETPFETYNIMEGFVEGNRGQRKEYTDKIELSLTNKNSYTNKNIFVDRNDDIPDSDVRCISRTNTTTSSTNTVQYDSHTEAKIACKLRALNNSPQHSVYTINAINTGTNVTPSYKYSCSTSDTAPTYTSNANTITNKTLYYVTRPITHNIRAQTRFIRSPDRGNYEYHKNICKNSNGRFTMASITSQADYDGIMKVFSGISTEHVILGGYRNDTSDTERGIWNWEDGSRWDNDIANRTKINNCGWGSGEPNDWSYSNWDFTKGILNGSSQERTVGIELRKIVNKYFGQHVLVLRPYGHPGLWDDHFRYQPFYAIYKEWYDPASVINYSVKFYPKGTFQYNVSGEYYGSTFGGGGTLSGKDIELPQEIQGCSGTYGGGINKDSVRLKYTFDKC